MPALPNDVDTFQSNWRFCSKCLSLFFDGFSNTGHCPAATDGDSDKGHSGRGSWDYILPANTPN